MAEGLLNTLAKGLTTATSAGERPTTKVDPKTVEVMKEIGIDISKQRPKPLTLKMVEEVDMVVTMGCGTEVCPVVPKRTEDWGLEDPAGKPIEKFREVREEIKRRVEKLIETLEVTVEEYPRGPNHQ